MNIDYIQSEINIVMYHKIDYIKPQIIVKSQSKTYTDNAAAVRSDH